MNRKYLIFTGSYNENNGGVVVQHKLCSMLNDLGYESYVHPLYERYYEINKNNFNLTLRIFLGFIKRVFSGLYKDHKQYKGFKLNPYFNTKLLNKKDIIFNDEWIVIYPEIAFGNPANAKNVVRWLLYNPGVHTKKIFFGENELCFKYNSAFSSYLTTMEHSKELKVIHYPLEHYNLDNASKGRTGTAYCLRKGRNKPIQHDLDNSILIDGKSHVEIAAIFKQVKTFISYDTYTAYSFFAVLCGCNSIVIPDEGLTEEQWYPNPEDRYGLSYGFDGVEQARRTAHLVKQHVIEEEAKSKENVENFIDVAESFFAN